MFKDITLDTEHPRSLIILFLNFFLKCKKNFLFKRKEFGSGVLGEVNSTIIESGRVR